MTNPNPLSVDQTWSYLEAGINHLLNNLDEGILYPRYMGLYTGVYNYCTSSRMNAGFSAEPLTSAISGRGANLLGSDLYRKLSKHLQLHLTKICAESEGFMDETLLNFYTRQWERYTKASKYINHIFSYLNRHWVKREIDEGHKGVYDIYTLALVSWREHLFTHLEHNVMEAVLKIVERQRNGESIEASLIQNVIKSFVSLGLDDADPSKSTLDVYKKYFEVPFVAATEVYFKTESEKFVSENSVTDYMIKAEARLKEEEDRVQVYLHPSTAKPLILTCETVLVKNHMEIIWEEFQHLLDVDKQDDLFRMYSLLSRIPEGLDPLRTRFEAHVRRAGLAAIERIADQSSDQIEPKTYVDALLEVHKRYNELVTSAFRGEAGFVASLDKACREFVNRNKICKASTSKSPEYLARFCDSLLRKSSKNPEEGDLEDLLNSIMTVFKYVEDKDVFQKFYSKMLAKRLVWANSASEDAEANMITKLKEACGIEYTSKLQRMFQDVNVSKDLNESFTERMNTTHDGSELNVDFSIMVLSTAAWPLQPPTSPFNIPEDVVKTYDRFQKFYQSKHNGRKLNWLFQLSKAELKANYLSNKPGGPKSGYTFQTSTYQMGILLQYNNALSYTRDELLTSTGLTAEVLDGTLGVLEKLKILIQNEDKFELNMDFKSKKIRVNLNMPVKSEQKVESDETHKTIEEDRKLLMQAAIVRIMKTRKVMKHVALMQEVIQQLKSRFQPKIPDIKKCIDVLLEKEYLERVEGQKDTFSYVA